MYSKFIKLVVLLSLLVCYGFAGRVFYRRFFQLCPTTEGKIHVTEYLAVGNPYVI